MTPSLRILHIANFSQLPRSRLSLRRGRPQDQLAGRYYSVDHKISNGLVRNGHHVYQLSYRDLARHAAALGNKAWGQRALQRHVLAAAHSYRPQLIVLGHTELLSVATLAALREDHPETPMLQWWVDLLSPPNTELLRSRLALLDALFTTSHPATVAELLGDPPRATELIHYLPNPCDVSIETESACDHPSPELDLFFAGSGTVRQRALAVQLRPLAGELRLGLYGGRDDGQWLYGRRYVQTLGTSRIGINYNSITDAIPLYSSDRLIHLTGNGVLALSPPVPQLDRLFPATEVPRFNDFDELRRLVHHYMQHDDALRAAARAAQQRSHRLYNERRVARFIVEQGMRFPLSEAYEWRNAALFSPSGS